MVGSNEIKVEGGRKKFTVNVPKLIVVSLVLCGVVYVGVPGCGGKSRELVPPLQYDI